MGTRAEPRPPVRGVWILRPALELTFLVALAALVGGLLVDAQRFFGRSWIDGIAGHADALHVHPGLNRLMMDITAVGAEMPLLSTFCALAFWSHRRRDATWARFFTVVMVGALALDNIIKPLVGRPRPMFDQLVGGRGFSFPSGHATATTALLIALAYLLACDRMPLARKAIWAAAISGSLLMGISRVYLGVHWPTDVIAGIVLGAGWTWMCARSQGITTVESHERTLTPWTARRWLVPLTVTLAVLVFA